MRKNFYSRAMDGAMYLYYIHHPNTINPSDNIKNSNDGKIGYMWDVGWVEPESTGKCGI